MVSIFTEYIASRDFRMRRNITLQLGHNRFIVLGIETGILGFNRSLKIGVDCKIMTDIAQFQVIIVEDHGHLLQEAMFGIDGLMVQVIDEEVGENKNLNHGDRNRTDRNACDLCFNCQIRKKHGQAPAFLICIHLIHHPASVEYRMIEVYNYRKLEEPSSVGGPLLIQLR